MVLNVICWRGRGQGREEEEFLPYPCNFSFLFLSFSGTIINELYYIYIYTSVQFPFRGETRGETFIGISVTKMAVNKLEKLIN